MTTAAVSITVMLTACAVTAFAKTNAGDPVPVAAFAVSQLHANQLVYVPVGPYERIDPFSDGMAVVSVNRKYGFIDSKGRMAIEPRYDTAGCFSEGKALVAVLTGDPNQFPYGQQYKWGMVDKTGKTLIELVYERLGDFSQSRAFIVERDRNGDDKIGFIDPNGQYVIPPIYQEALSFSEGIAAVRRLNYWGYIDRSGNRITGLRYKQAEPFSDGLAAVQVGEKWGYINRVGETAIEPQFLYVRAFSNGMAVYSERTGERDWKCGFINQKGEKVIPAQFDTASDFRDGNAAVSLNGKIGLVNRSGQFRETDWNTYNQVAGTIRGPQKLVGFKDWKSGAWIIPPRFLEAGSFHQGFAKVRVPNHPWKWGYIDRKGKAVIPPIYDEAGDFSQNRAAVVLKGQSGFVNVSGRFVPDRVKPKNQIAASERKTIDLYVTVMKETFNLGNGGSGFIAVDFKDMNNISPAGRQLIMKQLGDLSPYVYDYAKVKNDPDKFDLSPNSWHAKNGTVLSISLANGQGDEAEISAGSLFGNLGAYWSTYRATYVNGRWRLKLLNAAVS